MSRHYPGGVYDADYAKQVEYAASLPPFLLRNFLLPRLRAGRRAVVLAEEWQTHAVLHLHWLLRYERARERIRILWNANNTFGFDLVPWLRLCEVATVTTVSRYMKQRMHEIGIEAVVIPNGLPAETFAVPDATAVGALRRRMRQRTTVAKLARWDPDKRWLDAVETVGEMKRQGWRPLLLARGGSEPYGAEVIAAAESHGLRVIERSSERGGKQGLLEALARVGDADVVVLRSHLDPEARRVLLRAADAVLANSRHEPFGLVGLETMASGGVACTGNTGEDYVVSGQNALVLETGEPREFMTLFAPSARVSRQGARAAPGRHGRRRGALRGRRSWSASCFPGCSWLATRSGRVPPRGGPASRPSARSHGAESDPHAGVRVQRFDRQGHTTAPAREAFRRNPREIDRLGLPRQVVECNAHERRWRAAQEGVHGRAERRRGGQGGSRLQDSLSAQSAGEGAAGGAALGPGVRQRGLAGNPADVPAQLEIPTTGKADQRWQVVGLAVTRARRE